MRLRHYLCFFVLGFSLSCLASEQKSTLHSSKKESVNVICKLAATEAQISKETDSKKRQKITDDFNGCVSLQEQYVIAEPLILEKSGPNTPTAEQRDKETDGLTPQATSKEGNQLTQSVWGTPDACSTSSPGAAAGAKILTVHRALVWPKEASDVYGRRLGKRFVIYQVTITNASTEFQYAVGDIVIDLAPIFKANHIDPVDYPNYSEKPPSVFEASSQDLEMLRGVAEKGQDYDPRNLTLHIMQGVGSVSAAISGLTPFSDVFGPAMGNYNGAFVQALSNTIFPDHTTTQLNRLSDMAFSQSNLIGKLQTKKYAVFVPEGLVMNSKDQARYWKNTRKMLDTLKFDQLNLCVDGLLLSQPQATPEPNMSSTEAFVSDGTLISLSDAAAGAIIYYTLDGSAPTIKSKKYTDPISITGTSPIVIQAFAVAPNQAPSGTVTSRYTVAAKSDAPKIECSADKSKTYTVTPAHAGEPIYISVDGVPTRKSTMSTSLATYSYTGDSVTVQAFEAADKKAISDVVKKVCSSSDK